MLTDDFFLGTKLHSKKLNLICAPLVQFLGELTQILYTNIDKNGRMFTVFSDPKWGERFITEKYYFLDPLMVDPKNIHNGFALDDSYDDQDFKDIVGYDGVVNFNWWHAFVYTEKTHDNGYFGFALGTVKENYHIVNKLMNESKTIRTLLRNVNKQLMEETTNLQQNKMDFATLKGDLFYSQKGLVFHEQQPVQNKIQLLQDLGILTGSNDLEFLTNAKLSPQEINCLRVYLNTQNIQKVAAHLKLAVATVTSYIENIKAKLNCNTKHSLFERAELLEALGWI